MAKYTLLELVQRVLSSTDGDQVNSISDTVDSDKIANLIEDVFYNMVVNKDIPEHEGLIKLESLSDELVPNYLKLPARVTEITYVKYDKSEEDDMVDYRDIKYKTPADFLHQIITRNASDDNIQQVIDPGSGVTLLVVNDRHPTFWTSFDDEYMVFDSFNAEFDDTLQSSKTMVIARRLPTFEKRDGFVMDIDDNLFPLLLNEAKSWAYIEDKQTAHPKAEQGAKRQRNFSQTQRHRINDENKNTRPDYGRRR